MNNEQEQKVKEVILENKDSNGESLMWDYGHNINKDLKEEIFVEGDVVFLTDDNTIEIDNENDSSKPDELVYFY